MIKNSNRNIQEEEDISSNNSEEEEEEEEEKIKYKIKNKLEKDHLLKLKIIANILQTEEELHGLVSNNIFNYDNKSIKSLESPEQEEKEEEEEELNKKIKKIRERSRHHEKKKY